MAGTGTSLTIHDSEYAELSEAAADFAMAVEKFLGRYISAVRGIGEGNITGATKENMDLFMESVGLMAGRTAGQVSGEGIYRFTGHINGYLGEIDKADKWVYDD